jgi:hypothetical protein
MQVDFNIANARRVRANLENGLSEIRTGLVIPETRVKNLHRSPVQGSQLIAPQPLVLPEALKYALRGYGVVRVPQRLHGNKIASAPSRVKIGRKAGHLAIAFRGTLLQSQARKMS